jgi:hypothetical protein
MKSLINPDNTSILNLRRLPGRLTYEQAGALLGFEPHEIPILVKERLLVPLAKPAENALKYLCAIEVEKRRVDPAWIGKATKAIYAHWQRKNRTTRSAPDQR